MEDKKWLKWFLWLAVLYIVGCIVVSILPFIVQLVALDYLVELLPEFIEKLGN